MDPSSDFPAYDLLGVRVHALSLADILQVSERSILRGERTIIAHHNLHSLYLYHQDPKMRAFYGRSSYVHADGMSLVLLGRLLNVPLRREHRVTYVDLLRPLLHQAARHGWRMFVVGSKPGVAARAEEVLHAELPGLLIETAHGYFDSTPGSAANEAVLSQIRAYRTDLLLVGMGMPRQEHWIVDHAERIDAKVIFTVGAAMDYVAGAVRTPPRWMGSMGLEWLFRLCSEPRRLWKRYLVEPWFILWLILRARAGRTGDR